MNDKVFKEDSHDIEESIEMVEKSRKSAKMVEAKIPMRQALGLKSEDDKKLTAKVNVEISSPAGPIKIKQGEDCSKFSEVLINRLKKTGVI